MYRSVGAYGYLLNKFYYKDDAPIGAKRREIILI
jgi:hypothetical protein